jgi:hypothetical protein
MKVVSGLLFLITFAGPVWAGSAPAQAPSPEMGAGVIGMTLAAGVVYLLKRRNRS